MGSCCTKDDNFAYEDNNAGLSLKYDDRDKKITGKEIIECMFPCVTSNNDWRHCVESESLIV